MCGYILIYPGLGRTYVSSRLLTGEGAGGVGWGEGGGTLIFASAVAPLQRAWLPATVLRQRSTGADRASEANNTTTETKSE